MTTPDGVPATVALASADSARWLRRYRLALVLTDAAALIVAGLLAVQARFGDATSQLHGVSYYGVAVLVGLGWVGVLGLSRCYEARFLGSGPEEYRRIFHASLYFVATVALVCYGFQLDVARGFIALVLPLGTGLLLLSRYLARAALYRQRKKGRCSHRVLVIGDAGPVADLVRQLRHEPLSGLRVVGACVSGGHGVGATLDLPGDPVPVVGSITTVSTAMREVNADTLAVAASPELTGEALRRLSYELEGTGVDLLVAPALTNVTGTRIHIRPIAGLPLLHVDEPELAGVRKLVKATFDWSAALTGTVLLTPLLVGIALAVRVTSPGPVLFRQMRVGRDGGLFSIWKFRTMYADAEQRLAELVAANQHDGMLFKMRQDPRVTPLGRFLRKYSLDEFPQLMNVLSGHMSLVGPRPPLPSEVERYEGHAHRRLLVKPGLTGLWQISGRSNLSWEDSVRLDLQYVENWSLGLDLTILAKSVLAVVRGSGAY